MFEAPCHVKYSKNLKYRGLFSKSDLLSGDKKQQTDIAPSNYLFTQCNTHFVAPGRQPRQSLNLGKGSLNTHL
jgi:hypothetical protein